MFGKKSNDTRLVGAAEKREKASKFRPGFKIESKREGKQGGKVIPVVVIYALAVTLALGMDKANINVRTSFEWIDRIFSNTPTITGTVDTDKVIIAFVRGLFLFAVAGFIPFLTMLWQRVLDRTMNVYLTFIGISITLPLLYVTFADTATSLQQLVK